MDIVHHALIGMAGYALAADLGYELVGMAVAAGAVLPDLDVVFMVGGKRGYLHNHQGPTHSLFVAPFLALLPAGIAWWGIGFDAWYWFAAWLGLLSHLLLDATNTFGIALFWPFNRKRFSLDFIFFIDLTAYGLTVAFMIIRFGLGITDWAWLYFALLAGYFLLKHELRRRVMAGLAPVFAIPSSLNPLEFFILESHPGGWRTYVYNAWTGKTRRDKEYARAAPRFQALAETSRVFREMKHVVKALEIVEVVEDAAGTSITAVDLAVRNFGGKFGRTELRFDGEDRLIHEMAHI